MPKKYIINLNISQREQLEQLSKKGKISARKYKRIQILRSTSLPQSDYLLSTPNALVASLKRHGVTDDVINQAFAEVING
ncbi:hypothetical protein IQ247_22205 [Plectonema cf. radiosum LEGE 06105]|uniref:Uncharacterized protein n=1 Tax=Plectonema cf. radiosum LEGE 06105 TaxID=945769 RepID=A0A8J7F505_9CYAN|nr:hypothetical protein [Plectonema radiosum]MBE9215342.1 hypothetical protein [Plectonema cf. radiosum LEGE 06105]